MDQEESKPKVLKITSIKQFWKCLKQLSVNANDKAYLVQMLKDQMNDIHEFLCQLLKDFASKPSSVKHKFLTKFLIIFGEGGIRMWRKFFWDNGAELFPEFFNLVDFSFLEMDPPLYLTEEDRNSSQELEDNPAVQNWYEAVNMKFSAKLLQIALPNPDHQTNENEMEIIYKKRNAILVENICSIAAETTNLKELFMSLCDFSLNQKRNTRKIIKIVQYFSSLFRKLSRKRCKHLPGTLYTIGGLLKNDTLSIIKHFKEQNGEDTSFLNQFYQQEEMQEIRNISEDDINIFKSMIVDTISEFIDSVTQGISLMKNALNANNNELFVSLTLEDFIDEYDDIHKKNPDLINPVESVYYCALFMADILFFYFKLMMQDPIATKGQLTFEEREKIRNQDFTKSIHPFFIPEFILSESPKLLNKILQSISYMTPNPIWIINLCRKQVLEPEQNKPETKEDATYERKTPFNRTGIAILAFFMFIPRITAHAKKLGVELSHPVYCLEEKLYLNEVSTHTYLFEFFAFALRDLFFSPTAFQGFGLQLLNYFLNFVPAGFINDLSPEVAFVHQQIGFFLVRLIGGQRNEIDRLCAIKLLEGYLELFETKQKGAILVSLIMNGEYDASIGFMVDYYRQQLHLYLQLLQQIEIDESTQKDQIKFIDPYSPVTIMDQILKKLLEVGEEYLMDIREKLLSGLNLYKHLLIFYKSCKENTHAKYHLSLIFNEQKNDHFSKHFLVPIIKTCDAFDSMNKEKGEEIPIMKKIPKELYEMEANKTFIIRENISKIQELL